MAEIATKGVLTLVEAKTLTGQSAQALVVYDVSTGAPKGLDVEVLIGMDASISGLGLADVSINASIAGLKLADASINSSIAGLKLADTSINASIAGLVAADASIYTDIYNVTGAVTHYKRVLADAGGVLDRTWLLKAYNEYIKQRPETVRLYIPELGVKERVSGLNKYGVKLYDISTVQADAAQATEATQPYMTINAAPNARKGLRFVQGQTQTGLMDFTDVVFAATDSWTLTKRVKINSKGTGRVYLGAAWIETTDTTIVLNSGTVAVLTGAYNFESGKTYTIEFQYLNATGLILVNGLPIATTPLSGAVTFGQISYSTTYPTDMVIYAYHLTNTRKSAAQSQLDHQFLSLLFPDVEGIAIGNQFWLTDNFCGAVAGDGTVIPEVQGATTDGNAELIVSTDLNTWTKGSAVTSASNLTFTTNATGSVLNPTYASLGKANRTILVGTSDVAWSLCDNLETIVSIPSGAFDLTSTPAYWKYAANLRILLSGAGTITFTSMSNKECGTSDSTLVYNYVYAATTGTAAVKGLAATKAAAMWCHYDNSAANGAVYGKLYNWYAVHLFDLYTPVRGWRVPSKADFDQLVAYNGTSTIAGGKLKAKFGGFDNAFANNESGFSAIPAGYVKADGGFSLVGINSYLRSASLYYTQVTNSTTSASITTADASLFFSLRLLRNAPATPDTFEKTTGYITNNIAVTPFDITAIPFGNCVMALRVVSETAMTGFQAVLYTGAGAAKETLCTGVAITANQPAYIPISVAQSLQLVDCTVRVSATAKTDTAGRFMVNVLLKSAYNEYL